MFAIPRPEPLGEPTGGFPKKGVYTCKSGLSPGLSLSRWLPLVEDVMFQPELRWHRRAPPAARLRERAGGSISVFGGAFRSENGIQVAYFRPCNISSERIDTSQRNSALAGSSMCPLGLTYHTYYKLHVAGLLYFG